MPDTGDRLRVLVLAPYLNAKAVGEVYSIFRWIEALSERCEVTVLTVGTDPEALPAQLPGATVVAIKSPDVLQRVPRFTAMAKPWLPVFFRWARGWIRKELARGRTWDIAHQVLPQAMRYASPLAGLGLPYVIGPLGGSLTTPPAFAGEVESGGLMTRLRSLDRVRLARDPWLRRGYEEADLILGVAPYILDTLTECGLRVRRFEPVLERSHEGKLPRIERTSGPGEAHLLHVGRVVRTKALRDVIRALAKLDDLPGVHLTSAGDGPDLAACRAEAEALGVSDRVRFLGRIPREDVDRLYEQADVFCFPSFREPMGGVFFEAMEFSLPTIAAARGGPDFILDESCAIKLPVDTPERFADDIATAIRTLALDPDLRRRLGRGAQERLRSFGGWPEKARHLEALYRDVLKARSGDPHARATSEPSAAALAPDRRR